jgi:hypothetical protein
MNHAVVVLTSSITSFVVTASMMLAVMYHFGVL